MCGERAKVIEEFRSLEETRERFCDLKVTPSEHRYSSIELDDTTNPDNPDMVDIVEFEEEGAGEGEEGEDEGEGEEEEEEEEEEEGLFKADAVN